jgi:hypothetical protein
MHVVMMGGVVRRTQTHPTQRIISISQTGLLAGGSFGALAGGYGGWSGGLRGSALLRAAGRTGAQTGAMFGLFLSIGSYLRTCVAFL